MWSLKLFVGYILVP